jgi:hypothetical protein
VSGTAFEYCQFRTVSIVVSSSMREVASTALINAPYATHRRPMHPRAGFAARIEARFDGVVRVGELSRQRSLAVDVVVSSSMREVASTALINAPYATHRRPMLHVYDQYPQTRAPALLHASRHASMVLFELVS